MCPGYSSYERHVSSCVQIIQLQNQDLIKTSKTEYLKKKMGIFLLFLKFPNCLVIEHHRKSEERRDSQGAPVSVWDPGGRCPASALLQPAGELPSPELEKLRGAFSLQYGKL